MSIGILFAAALIPPAILLAYIYKKDKIEPEPPKLLALLFLGGCLSTILALIGETVLGNLLNKLGLNPYGVLYNILDAFIVVAVVEEGSKLLFLKWFSWKKPAFNFVFDAVVYSVFVSLGFAALENVEYVLMYGIGVAFSRALMSIPGHLCFSVFMGIFYGRAKLFDVHHNEEMATKNMWQGYLYAVVAHGIYDACLMIGTPLTTVIFFIYIVAMDVYVYRLIKRAAYYDRPIY